jgi:hypothetical protein
MGTVYRMGKRASNVGATLLVGVIALSLSAVSLGCLDGRVESLRERGCLDGNTLIRMADGTDLAISALQQGDIIFNPMSRGNTRILSIISHSELATMIEITAQRNKLKVTANHPFPTEPGLKRAKDILRGDLLFDTWGRKTPVEEVKMLPIEKRQDVYNLQLVTSSTRMEDHLILANGIVAGDIYLQENFDK